MPSTARSTAPIQDLSLYLAEKPAKFFGLWPQKGALMVGADADVTVLKDADWIYDSAKAHDDLNWTPYDGERFACRIAATFLRGAKVWDGTSVLGKPGMGQYARHVRSKGDDAASAKLAAAAPMAREHA